MRGYSRRQVLGLLPKLSAAAVLSTALASVPEAAQGANLLLGQPFGYGADGRRRFPHYVEFFAPLCAASWQVEGPLWCQLWPPGKPMCGQPWGGGPDGNGYVR